MTEIEFLKEYLNYGALGLTCLVCFVAIIYLEKSRTKILERGHARELETLEVVKGARDALKELTEAVEALV